MTNLPTRIQIDYKANICPTDIDLNDMEVFLSDNGHKYIYIKRMNSGKWHLDGMENIEKQSEEKWIHGEPADFFISLLCVCVCKVKQFNKKNHCCGNSCRNIAITITKGKKSFIPIININVKDVYFSIRIRKEMISHSKQKKMKTSKKERKKKLLRKKNFQNGGYYK